MPNQTKSYCRDVQAYFKNGKICVWKDLFAVVKSRKPHPGAFANIIDPNEITVIIEQDRIRPRDALAVELGWRVITFNMVLPFDLTGFLATIAATLAEAGVGLLAVSSYSTDHILIRDRDLIAALDSLRGLGFIVEEK